MTAEMMTPAVSQPFAAGVLAANRGVTFSAIQEAVAQIMHGARPDVPVDTALAGRVAADIQPVLAAALLSGRAASGQELLAGPGFATIVTQYLGSPGFTSMDDALRKAMLDRLRQANVTGADMASAARSLGFDLLAVAGQSDSSWRFSALANDLRNVDPKNYPSTQYFALGISYGVFDALRGQGFDGSQIVAAAQMAQMLGIGVNGNVAAIANLQRGMSDAKDALTALHDGKQYIGEAEKELAAARASGDQARIEAAEKHLRDLRQYYQNYEGGYRGKVQTKSPNNVQNWDQISAQAKIRGVDFTTSSASSTAAYNDQHTEVRDLARHTSRTEINNQASLTDDEKAKQMEHVATANPNRPAKGNIKKTESTLNLDG